MKAFYFPHDDNAAGDEGVLKLRAKFGNTEGYAMWFMLLEFLARNGGTMDGSTMAELSLSYAIPAAKWQEFVQYCLQIGLLAKKGMLIISYRLVEHMGYRKERVESGRKGAGIRWNKSKNIDGTANGTAIAQALAEPMAGEERRGEDKKETTKLGKNYTATAKLEPVKVDVQPPAPARQQKTDAQIEVEFYEAIQAEGWADQAYADKTMQQLGKLTPANRVECHRKMRVMMNAYRSKGEQTRKLAHKMYGEVVGFINDHGLMEKQLSAKELEKRRELTASEN